MYIRLGTRNTNTRINTVLSVGIERLITHFSYFFARERNVEVSLDIRSVYILLGQ